MFNISTRQNVVIDDGDFVQDSRLLLMSPKKDRILFRKNDHTLSEYLIQNNGLKLHRHLTDEKHVISDFCYYRSQDKDSKNDQILVLSNNGVLKRINCSTGQSRKFEISTGTSFPLIKDGKNFQISFCNFLSYILITFNRKGDDGMHHVAFVIQPKPDELNFINEVVFNTGIGTVIFTLDYDTVQHASFSLMCGNYPAFVLATSASNVALGFSIHGVKIVQVGSEYDLESGSLKVTSRGRRLDRV